MKLLLYHIYSAMLTAFTSYAENTAGDLALGPLGRSFLSRGQRALKFVFLRFASAIVNQLQDNCDIFLSCYELRQWPLALTSFQTQYKPNIVEAYTTLVIIVRHYHLLLNNLWLTI